MAELTVQVEKEEEEDLIKRNSRIIKIKRTNNDIPFYDESNPQHKAYYMNSQLGQGVRHESGTKTSLHTGLTTPQVNLLLPFVTDIDTVSVNNGLEAQRMRKEYYGKLRAYIPFESGLSLEIGLTRSNDEPMGPDNLPINIEHYIKFMALFNNDPVVAKNKEQGKQHRHYKMYIEDGQAIESAEEALANARMDAMQHFMTINNSVPNMRKFIMIMEGKSIPRSIVNPSTLAMRLMALINTDPFKFNKAFLDKNSEDEYLLILLTNFKVIDIKVGGIYYDVDSKETLGNNKAQMLSWLKDKNNNNSLVVMKNVLAERINMEPAK